ncbi:MAG: PorT family protein, partial [Bacteroidota bacterium]|nr:PorT family protein [Bacteroidota bacterium]
MNRYHTFILFSIFSLIVSDTIAQMPEWSLRGGLNFSTFGGADASGSRFKIGPHVGFFGSLPIGPDYRLESGFAYSLKGANGKVALGDASFRFHYLEVPILARFNVVPELDVL